MKRIFFLFILGMFLSACESNDNETAELLLSENICTLSYDKPYTKIDIINGKKEYKAKSSDQQVAISLIDGNELLIFGVGKGEAIITVTDRDNLSANVKVKINADLLGVVAEAEQLALECGKQIVLDYPVIPTGQDYLYSENENIASASISGDKIVITAITRGKTKIYLAEWLWSRYVYEIEVYENVSVE